MKLATLVENTAAAPGYACVHGLSFYIEAAEKKLLFDLGPDETLFANAQKAGISVENVELAVLSHGHYDHGGALGRFLEINRSARVYVRENAFLPYYSRSSGKEHEIGLSRELKGHPRVVPTGENCDIAEGLRLFSGVTGRKYFSEANRFLMEKTEKGLRPDSFSHEQNLIITEGNKKFLIAGCAHNGIVNILERFEKLEGRLPDAVISGFHLNPPSAMEPVSEELLDGIAGTLLKWPVQYYTCHCTGLGPYAGLKKRMGERLNYLGAGSRLEL